MTRDFFSLAAALPLALLLAGCADGLLPTAAPEGPVFVQLPSNPVVNSLLDDGTGCTETTCTLRDAIEFASAGATITFAVTGTITLTQGELLIDKNLTINGPGATSLSVSGDDASRVFQIASGATITLSALTITGGNGGLGGGINNRGTLTLTHSTVAGNRASQGGGIYNEPGATLTLTHSILSGNAAPTGTGGGIYNVHTLTLQNSTLSGNEASIGGGIYNEGTLTLNNSTLSGNEASSGGGIFNDQGTLTLTHSTVARNFGGFVGGGIYNFGEGTLTLQNSVIANNTSSPFIVSSSDCVSEASVIDNGYNLVGEGSCISNSSSVDGDPLLGPLADNGGPTRTHALLPGSPAIDAIPFGTSGCGHSTDQRGFPRPQGGACDIGAFEVQPPTLTLGIAANGTLTKRTGAATLSGTASCSSPVAVTLNVSLSQTQTKGKNTTTVSGSGSTSVSCTGSTAWTVTVTPESGKFAAGAADATAEAGGASAGQTVQLK